MYTNISKEEFHQFILGRCDEISIECYEEEIKQIALLLNMKVWDYKFHKYNDFSFIDPINKKIRFKYLLEDDFDTAVKTLAHELRHQFQIEVINNNIQHHNKEIWTNAYNEFLSTTDEEKRLFNILEVDAAAFAMNYLKQYHNSTINYKSKKFNKVVKRYLKEKF